MYKESSGHKIKQGGEEKLVLIKIIEAHSLIQSNKNKT